MPRISIVTISFNQLKFLERCVDSVRGQDFVDYEHIIVDPGSTDGSREWLEQLEDPQIQVIFKADSGPAQGLNNGLAACKGEIFLYLNADDEIAPSALSKLQEIHEVNTAADIVIGNGWTIDEIGLPLQYVRSDRFSPRRYALSVATVLQQSTSFKRRVIDNGLLFNEANRYTWDTELLFDALRSGARFLYVDDALGYFRMQADSITASGRYDTEIQSSVDKLIDNSVGRQWRVVGRAFSLPARSLKYVVNSIWKARKCPQFPGLVISKKDQMQ